MDIYDNLEFRRAHFIGVGGIGMSGIARVLLQMGYEVSGSDLSLNNVTERLQEMGALIHCGHAASNVGNADIVVVSSAVPDENPELMEAKKRGLKVMHRGQMLSWLMRSKVGIAIAGTHGKTTTTSMVACMLENYGMKPTVIVGGEVNGFGTNANLGAGDYLVAEADESDASFVDLSPQIAVVTSVDPDVNLSTSAYADCGFDHEATRLRVEELFVKFMNKVGDAGAVILCLDHPRIKEIYRTIQRRVVTYGFDAEADITARQVELANFTSRCRVFWRGRELGELVLNVPGRHNVQNALAAVAVGLEIGLDFSDISRLLSKFQGVRHRFQILSRANGIVVVDDYAHNPSKVKAAIHAAHTGSCKRVIAVFQPHRYTRTKFFQDEYASSFGEADALLVTDIYSACETPIPGITSQALIESIHHCDESLKILSTPSHDDVLACLRERCQSGDIVVFLGAGDISKCAVRAAEMLAQA